MKFWQKKSDNRPNLPDVGLGERAEALKNPEWLAEWKRKTLAEIERRLVGKDPLSFPEDLEGVFSTIITEAQHSGLNIQLINRSVELGADNLVVIPAMHKALNTLFETRSNWRG